MIGRWWNVLAGIVVGVLVAPSRVDACSCDGGPLGVVSYPLDEATDVATDTPIVIRRYFLGGDTETIGFSLEGPGGKNVPLVETMRLPPAWEGCGKWEVLFLRPAALLEPGAVYSLSIDETADPERRWGATFTVGGSPFEAEPGPDVVMTYLALSSRPECDQCFALAELLVDLGEAPTLPRWIVVESQADENAVDDKRVLPAGWTEDAYELTKFSVALPADDTCVDVRIYGVEGRLLFDERRCEPDVCATYGAWSYSSCGGPPRSGVDVARLASGSCDDPPQLEVEPGAGIIYPDPTPEATPSSTGTGSDAGVEAQSSEASAGGCAVGRGETRPLLVPWWLAALAVAFGRRRLPLSLLSFRASKPERGDRDYEPTCE